MTLSVIVPVYNTEKYLRRCLDSILAQTRLPDEIICVNDGSTDGSKEILEEYAANNQLIKVIYKENGGLVSARKAGIKAAVSDYVTYVDSDDYIETDMYEKLMGYVEECSPDMVTSGFVRDYGEYTISESEKIKKGLYTGIDFETKVLSNLIDTEKFYRYNLMTSLCNKIFRRDLLTPIQLGVNCLINMGEDDVVTYSYLLNSNSIYISGEEFYHYCIRNSSMSGTKDELEEQRVNIMLETVKNAFESNVDRLPRLKEQYKLFSTNFNLIRDVSSILKTEGDILYPFGVVKKDERILLYGAGSLGIDIFNWIKDKGYNVIGIADKNASKNNSEIISLDDIKNIEFDKLIISASNANVAESISGDLKEIGIEEDKLLRIDVNLIK